MDYTSYGVAPRVPAPAPVPDKVTRAQDRLCLMLEDGIKDDVRAFALWWHAASCIRELHRR